MKILVTGSTAKQVDSPRVQLAIVTSIRCYVAALREMGHEVEWRAVQYGEDLSHYDRRVAFLQTPGAFPPTSYAYGVLWCALTYPDTILGFDDWQTRKFADNWRGRLDRTQCPHPGIDAWLEGNWHNKILLPAHDGGDLARLWIPGQNLVAVDPSAYAPTYATRTCSKQREWVLASLSLKKPIRHRWPMRRYGQNDRIAEEHLMHAYCDSWGVLSPAHPHSGSGWWRYRYAMAVGAGCVLSADLLEARVIGGAYEVASNPMIVEELGDAELERLAGAQRECWQKRVLSRDEVRERLSALLS